MRSQRGMMIAGLAAASAMVGLAMPEPTTTPVPAGSGRARRPAPPYRLKRPVTEGDHERIRLAEAKRARKAERLRQAQANGGIR